MPQVSGIYEGWGQPDFLQDVTGRMAQDCSPLAHLHSPDLHPWPHQTDLHLTMKKEEKRVVSNITKSAGCIDPKWEHYTVKMYYLWGFHFGWKVPWVLFFLMVPRMDQLLRRLWTHQIKFNWFIVKHLSLAELYECMSAQHGLTCVGREGPFLACGIEVRDISLRSIPGLEWGLPWWRGAAGSWLCHPGRICSWGVGAALFSKEFSLL